jgi:hypothetical protein
MQERDGREERENGRKKERDFKRDGIDSRENESRSFTWS